MSKQYSDLPEGFTVYSDVPEGFTVAPEPMPDFSNKVSGSSSTAAGPSFLDVKFAGLPTSGRNAIDYAVGAGKSVGKQVQTGGQFLEGLLGMQPSASRPGLEPTNPAQQTGKTAGDIASFFVPGAATSKIAKGAETVIGATKYAPAVQKLLSLGTRAGLEAGSAGVMTGLQGGSASDVKVNMALAGAIPIVATGVGKAVSKMGEKIEGSVIRASTADVKDGFKVGNVFKYGVQGPLDRTAAKTGEQISERVKELDDILKNTPGSQKVDVYEVLLDTMRDQGRKSINNVGFNEGIKKAGEFWAKELNNLPMKELDLSEATGMKRSVGRVGSWLYGHADLDASALEKFSSAYYSNLKTAIEKASPKGTRIAQINKELGELIPIENAVMRRIPVAERQNMISLTDVITLTNPNTLWLSAINKFSKTGTAARALYGAGEAATRASTTAARGAAAGSKQAQRDF